MEFTNTEYTNWLSSGEEGDGDITTALSVVTLRLENTSIDQNISKFSNVQNFNFYNVHHLSVMNWSNFKQAKSVGLVNSSTIGGNLFDLPDDCLLIVLNMYNSCLLTDINYRGTIKELKSDESSITELTSKGYILQTTQTLVTEFDI